VALKEEKSRKRLLHSLGEFRRQTAFYARVLPGGKTLEHRADVSFFPLDFVKLWLLFELYRQAEEGLVRFDDRYKMVSAPIGNGPLGSLLDRPVLSLLDYCRLMLIFGDEDATHMLQSVLWEAQSKESGVRRPYSRCYSTPRELARVFETLAAGKLVTCRASAKIIEILRKTASRGLDPFLCEVPTGALSVHRAATNLEVRADVGLVFLPETVLVISIFSDSPELGGPPYDLVQDLARQIVDWSQL
jgi:hypothetical protein